MPALLLGSISAVADTSELQREAFNRAFAAHGLDWTWEGQAYRDMLATSGGAARIAEYARARGEAVDAAAVHATKSELFQQSLAGGGVSARPGVVDTIAAARARGWQVGLVTTTSTANVTALLAALKTEIDPADLATVVDASRVAAGKPAPDAYELALRDLSEDAATCVAVEDNVDGVRAARAAGVPCVAFPNVNTAEHDFAGTPVVDHLDLDDLIRAATRQ